MSSLKRKDAPGGPSAAKSTKPPSDTRPSKRPKAEKASKPDGKVDAKQAKASEPKPAKVPIISRLKEEEPLFPRGGGSVLSPLEHKQIQIQAKHDALFEQDDTAGATKSDKASRKKKRKSGGKSEASDSQLARDEDSIKIESLNYKRLVKGSLILGQVSEINALDLVIMLPNNLAGHVSIASISQTLTKRIEAEAADSEVEDEDSTDDNVDLSKLFHIGQYLRAYVVSTIDDSATGSGKGKRRIELSLLPELANSGLSDHDLVENCTVMASVLSEEDHGYVMGLGIDGADLHAFLPKKEVDARLGAHSLQPGSVFLCLVTKKNGKVIQLSTLVEKLGNSKNVAADAPTIKSFLPGSAVDVLVSEVSRWGIAGKVLGHLDVTADLTHSGAGPDGVDLEDKYKVGSKIKARIICTFSTASTPKLGFSLLDHVVSLQSKLIASKKPAKEPLDVLPISAFVERCEVRKVEQDIGLWVDVGIDGVPGFVHISRVKDGKVDALYESSGPYKVGSVHRGRVVGYNSFDGLYLLSLEQHVLEQPFLRIGDIPIGQIVNGTIEKLIVNDKGVSGLILKLADGISGLVPEMHMADVRLQHPEKKFKEGMKVKARVLSTNPSKHQFRLTLKKTLVNSESSPLSSFDNISVGLQTLGTIINVLNNGAVVQFYGSLRGFLPISEMSEAYIHDAKEHFRVGQVVNVRVLDVDAEANKLIVSCKDPSAFGMEKQLALKNLKIGDTVAARVTQKTEDDVFLELEGSLLKATLPAGHLSDKSMSKNLSALKKIHVGQLLTQLIVLDKNESRKALVLSQKPSLIKASEAGELLASWDDAKIGAAVCGFVRNVTATAAFIQFAANLTALLPKSLMPSERHGEPDFGLHKYQTMIVKIVSVDNGRLVVSVPSESDKANKTNVVKAAENPLDNSIKTFDDVTIGRITKARITAVKETQLNIALADNIHGRIDITEVFDSWDDIANAQDPLANFHEKQMVRIRVLGVHDARTHSFLPFSHRATQSLLECSAKPSTLQSQENPKALSLGQIDVSSSWLGFVNNHGPNCLWISLTPTVRGRLNAFEVSDDLTQVKNLAANHPIGTAIRVRVTNVDTEHGRLDLSARTPGATENSTWDTVKQGMVLPGKVTKVNERQVLIQLSKAVSGPIHLVDLSDDYESATTVTYSKNDIVRVAVVELDRSNKKIRLSARPSRVLNSSLPVEDREIVKGSKIEAGDIIRGFVKNVADKGLFVNLGGDVTGFVRISDLSDRYLKEWKEHFQIDQLVKARVVAVDAAVGHIQLSLKASVVDENYVPPRTLESFSEGEIVTGKVRKVEDFGAFILLDNSANVSGLCHRSEMAEKATKDARRLYKEGDAVKTKVLAVDVQKKRINLGLKPSYFDNEDEESDMDMDDGAVLASEDDDSDDEDMQDVGGAVLITGTDNGAVSEDESASDDDVDMDDITTVPTTSLETGGFDWSGAALDATNNPEHLSEDEEVVSRKTKKRKGEIQMDRTADLDVQGPQTASDFERLLLGQPNSSELWTGYMAFQMRISELAKAREIAERALDTINPREETEKFNMWIAYLNLEVAYGTDETVDEVFKRACQYNDKQEVHERLAQSYILSKKHSNADDLFQIILKLFGSKTPKVWVDYAHFLHHHMEAPDKARALLGRAVQRLDKREHVQLMAEFASLEFQSPSGNPERGRTIFEGILDSYPKRADLWSRLLDLENSYFKAEQAKGKDGEADPTVIRDLFERRTKAKGLKARVAMKWFERWSKWEEEHGDAKSREKVRAKAKEWVAEAERRKAEKEQEENDEEE